jgi:hypothetical protein
MRARLFCAIVVSSVCASATVAAQTTTTTASANQTGATKSITLTGCVARDASDATHFALADFTSGETTYRLTGAADVRKYLGKRVTVSGSRVEPKVAIVGGLVPSPNVAAQAGAIDPTRAAMAAQGSEANGRPGTIQVPEFRVRTVREGSGGCVSNQR